MTFPILGHHDAPQIRMPGKTNPKKIINFTLEIIRTWPYRCNGINRGTGTIQVNLKPKALLVLDREQVVDNLKSRLRWIPVHTRNIREKVEGTGRIVSEQRARLADV